MAAACAEYLNADQLIYLTDVAGVLDGEKVISAISCEEVERLVQCRVVSGGMVLKLEAAKRALEGGVRGVHIIGGTAPDALIQAVRAAETSDSSEAIEVAGTRVVRDPLSGLRAVSTAA
jgi:acetylglutamate kinase